MRSLAFIALLLCPWLTQGAALTTGGVQSGTVVSAADGKYTNTFATPFASAPAVTTTPVNSTVVQTNTILSTTITRFVGNVGASGITVNWIAVGPVSATGGVPIRDLPKTNATPPQALLIVDQPYPGRSTNDTFTTTVSNLFSRFGFNPTVPRVPFKQSLTNWGDSSWEQLANTNAMGFNSSDQFLASDVTSHSLGLGFNAGSGSSGTANIAIGDSALQGGAFGNRIAIGFQAMQAGGRGDGIAIGDRSQVASSGLNVTVGGLSGFSLTTGSQNTLIGSQAGEGIITGNHNSWLGEYIPSTGVGFEAANSTFVGSRAQLSSDPLTNVRNSVLIGYFDRTNSLSALTNVVTLGFNVIPTANNEIRIGNPTNDITWLQNIVKVIGSGNTLELGTATVPYISGQTAIEIFGGASGIIIDPAGVGRIYPSTASIGMTIGTANRYFGQAFLSNNVTIYGTTNFVTFGSTNVAPSTPGTIDKWVSVSINGEATAYRVPLYK